MTWPLVDITPFTLQDYPRHVAGILWFAGCNLRCCYCHNGEFLDLSHKFLSEQQVESFLKSRVGLLDGIVLSGGECTLAKNLPDLARIIKKLGFLLKIDTNGLKPQMLKKILKDSLVDFVALDFKAPRKKFTQVTQMSEDLYDIFETSLQLLVESFNHKEIDLEIRTTVHTVLLREEDLNCIIERLDDFGYEGTYYLQNFRLASSKKTPIDLGEEIYQLDFDKISQPRHFLLNYRNFF
jgi:pyruvate formate lyase activating enzyme